MSTLFERVGGAVFFDRLTRRFYDGVAADPVVRHVYPDDLTPGRVNLRDFLIQYFGGPATYSEQRGHPRLRLRHAPFTIGEAERDAWLRHMTAAVEASDAGALDKAQLLSYFQASAAHMVNQHH